MTLNFSWAGDPNVTSGFTSYANSFVYSSLTGFPQGNPDRAGVRYVNAVTIGSDYATGASGIYTQIWNGNGQNARSGTLLTNPAGNFNHEIHSASGTMYFGRNTAAGGVVTNAADGFQWAGTLCGWIDYATAPTACTAPSVSMSAGGVATASWGGPASDGGQALQTYELHWATDTAFTQNAGYVQTGLTTSGTVSGLKPGTTYYFLVIVSNGLAWSANSGTTGASTLSGGRVWNGSAWVPGTIRAWNGSAWTSTNVRVWNGSAWVNGL